MKLTPFIIVGIYMLMFGVAGFAFGAKPVLWTLGVMLAIATVLYIAIIIEEKPWKFAFPGRISLHMRYWHTVSYCSCCRLLH